MLMLDAVVDCFIILLTMSLNIFLNVVLFNWDAIFSVDFTVVRVLHVFVISEQCDQYYGNITRLYMNTLITVDD